MLRVVNIRDEEAADNGVYIGRPSRFGNPFVIGKDGTRDEVVDRYRAWLCDQPDLVATVKRELRGKNLNCWCAPRRCHGDVLLEIANADSSK